MGANNFQALLQNQSFVSDLKSDLTSREVAQRWGVGKSSVNDWRKLNKQPVEPVSHPRETVEFKSDGSRTVEAVRTRPITMDDARDWLRASGDDPELFDISIRSIAYGADMFSNRMSATPKRGVKAETVITADDYAKASSFISGFEYIPAKKEFLVGTAVIEPTDFQLGKVDLNGGTDSTINRALQSYENAIDYIKEYRPKHVVMAHCGDGIENFCNTSSQATTNDMDLPHQILTMFQLELKGLQMLAPHANKLTAAWVPSNHSRWRSGMKQDSGNSHADFGITNAKMIATTLSGLPGFEHVDVQIPVEHMESMTVYTEAVNVGMVHGHQASGPDKMGDWWAKQDHGRMPTWDADVLFAGHWHSYRAYQSGDGRGVFVGPANEPGSSWYSNLKGERATSGMLAVSFTSPKNWCFQEIL